MSFFTFVTTLMIASSAAAAEGQNLSSEPIVQVGLYGYRADGSVSGWAVTGSAREPTLDSVVYVSRCGMGAGNRQPPADATDSWRVSGKVLSSNAEQAVVQLDWLRVLAQGQTVNAPSGSSQLTLALGDRVLLDSVTPDGTSRCQTTSIGFEARYAPRAFPITGKAGAGSGRIASGSAGGGSGGGVSGFGAGRAPTGGGGGARIELAGAGLYDVNLWLVHSAPDKSDEVLHQTLRSAPRRAAFAFAPVTIDTPRGAVIVQVTGSVTVVDAASGQKLIFDTDRRVTFPQADQSPRDNAAGARGGSISARPMPGPDDVLSFEMPPILMNGRPTVPDKFSVRVQITPR